MKLTAAVVQDREETWFEGKSNEVKKRVLTLLDRDPESDRPMKQTLDYRPTDDECKAFPRGSLDLKTCVFSVSDLKPGKAGRIVVVGHLVDPKVNGVATGVGPQKSK